MKELDIRFAGAILPQEQDGFIAFLKKENLASSTRPQNSKNHTDPLIERAWNSTYRPNQSLEKTCDVFGKNGRGAMLIWWPERYKGTRHPGLMYLRFPRFKYHAPLTWADNALGFDVLFKDPQEIPKGQLAQKICQLIVTFPAPEQHKSAHAVLEHAGQWKRTVQKFKQEHLF